MEARKTNIMFNKNGHGSATTRVALPVPWIKDLNFDENSRNAIIVKDDKKISIYKEEFNMLLIKEENVKNELENMVDYVLENGVELYDTDWNGEIYRNGYLRKEEKNTNCTYKPIFKFDLENIDISTIEENSKTWNNLTEIVGFEEN